MIGSKLGAINHTLLTLELLKHSGLGVLACVLNHPYREKDSANATNEQTLRRLVPLPLSVIPNRTGDTPPWDDPGFDALALQVAHCLDPL